ncbi:MAG: glycosyltransferase family 2 protein [Parcubacteria group bacterium]|jgi:cellulose synthase/poly-beta-1,6-N-acetylglucosamine synthase-like glycosyltransferase
MNILKFLNYPHHSEAKDMDFSHRGDFCFLPEIHSTRNHIYAETVSFGMICAVVFFLAVFLISLFFKTSVLVVFSGSIALFYFVLMLFKLWIVCKALTNDLTDFTREEIELIKDDELPMYTILIPLYREEQVIRQIMKAMTAINYPVNKLDIIITLEEYDYPTINAIKKAGLPSHFKTLILPNVQPKTKPKALNVAFLKTKGEFLVIYDAEIIPEADQLKKAYLAFQKFPEIACFQTRLDHYNSHQNVITKLFNAEFSFYYDLFLPGLSQMGLPLSLSGHSTHFRKEAIGNIGAWDPYNVAEDCDLGIRLQRMGYKVGLLNSVSQEEATSDFKSWIMQRTRWMKGFIQTSIVHLRHPFRFKNEIGGWKNFIGFILTVPGTVLINILNLFYWTLLILWFITHSEIIKLFFPDTILYVSVVSFIIGNLIFTYLNLIGAYQRKRYELVKYSLLSPLYWVLLAIAGVRAFIQIIIKPHHWEKTTHGKHLPEDMHLIIKDMTENKEKFIPENEYNIATFEITKTTPYFLDKNNYRESLVKSMDLRRRVISITEDTK